MFLSIGTVVRRGDQIKSNGYLIINSSVCRRRIGNRKWYSYIILFPKLKYLINEKNFTIFCKYFTVITSTSTAISFTTTSTISTIIFTTSTTITATTNLQRQQHQFFLCYGNDQNKETIVISIKPGYFRLSFKLFYSYFWPTISNLIFTIISLGIWLNLVILYSQWKSFSIGPFFPLKHQLLIKQNFSQTIIYLSFLL